MPYTDIYLYKKNRDYQLSQFQMCTGVHEETSRLQRDEAIVLTTGI
jgi:hypothetical protein